jgi:hypothetical protein
VSAVGYAALSTLAADPDAAPILGTGDPDELITLRQAAEELPRRRAGRKCALQTLYRWTSPRGCKGIVLRSTQVGCCRCTTRRWLGEFFAALAARSRNESVAASTPATAPLAHRTAAARRRAAEADRKCQ